MWERSVMNRQIQIDILHETEFIPVYLGSLQHNKVCSLNPFSGPLEGLYTSPLTPSLQLDFYGKHLAKL